MILQALKAYYDRKAADPDSDIAPLGWEKKELPFLLIISPDGKSIVNLEDTREMAGKKKVAKIFLVPQAVKRSSGVAANFLWDNVEYVTGILCKAGGKPERVAGQHQDFRRRLRESLAACPSVAPVLNCLDLPDLETRLEGFPAWADAKKECAFLSFRIAGQDEPVFRAPDVVRYLASSGAASGEPRIRCLISGEPDMLQLTHPALKGVAGANTTGGNLVSFNMSAANSFGKKQGKNAPVGAISAFAYTTALNTLLAKNSRQKLSVGDATTIFWADRGCALENFASFLFNEPPKDDPDRNTDSIRELYRSVDNGSFATDRDGTRFFVLGLSPNAARVSVRFWHAGTVAEAGARFREYFDDLTICHTAGQPDHLSLWRLLCAIAPEGKTDNIIPGLAGDLMRAILEGLPFPDTLLAAAVMRLKADSKNDRLYLYPRVKLIKAYLNRKFRVSNPKNERMLTVSLDTENRNIGYRLGRLFATLEKIQQEANPGINATIRERCYASASSSPVTVFGTLMRLKNHHLAKLDSGRSRYFEQLLGEIFGGIQDFPAHLPLRDQGQFAIGYYHQNRTFYTRKNDNQDADAANQ